MARQLFIVLMNPSSWRVMHFDGAQCMALRAFERSEEARSALLAWWQRYPQAQVSFLSNHPDEQYHVEVLPDVSGFAGKQLLKRKLAAWPFSNGLHAACKLDRVQAQRRESRFLFTALPDARLFDWMHQLQASSVRIRGVYTHALAMLYCLPEAMQRYRHTLCLDVGQQQLRVSYLQHQRLFFSRMLPLPEDSFATPAACAAHVLQALHQIRMTLFHQQWVDDQEDMQLVCFGQWPAVWQILKQALAEGYVWVSVSDEDLTQQSTIKPMPQGITGLEWATIQCVLKRKPLPNLATDAMLLPESIRRLKRTIHWTGAVMASMMIIAAGLGWQITQNTHRQLQSVKRQLALWQSAPMYPIRPTALPQLRALTQAVRELTLAARWPERALTIMQHAMMGQSHWQVTALEWHGSAPAGLDTLSVPRASPSKETLIVTWTALGASAQQADAWQQLLARLRAEPDIAQVEVLTSSVSATGELRAGSTSEMRLPSQQPVIKLYLRAVDPAGDE